MRLHAIFDRSTLRRLMLWSAVAFPLAALGAALAADDWPARRFLALYVAPIFAAAPLWVRLRLEERWPPRGVAAWLDGAVLFVAFLRFVVGELLPFSGHMLFLVYSAMTTRHAAYRWLAVVLLAETTVFKLWLWRDAASWGAGLGLGVVAALGYRWASAPQPT